MNMKLPHFRPLAAATDTEQVLSLWRSLKDHYEHPIGGDWTTMKLYEELKTKSSVGAFDEEGHLQAFCLYIESDGIKEITLLATQAREHRTGAMRALVRSIISDLKPGEKVWLEVHAGNLPAIGLYESLGFRVCGERLNYYSDGGKALLYEWDSGGI